MTTKLNRSLGPRWNNFMDTFFDNSFLQPITELNVPATNIEEHDTSYTIKLAAPGLAKDDFNIKVENKNLIVWTEKENTSETKVENYTKKEYNYSSFTRSFVLPQNCESENIEANYEKGELIINLPKKEKTASESRIIEVS